MLKSYWMIYVCIYIYFYLITFSILLIRIYPDKIKNR